MAELDDFRHGRTFGRGVWIRAILNKTDELPFAGGPFVAVIELRGGPHNDRRTHMARLNAGFRFSTNARTPS